jgi:hypothetical protein
MDTSTVPRGQAVDPSQAGFHFLKREWVIIPFIYGKEKSGISFGQLRPDNGTTLIN